MMSNSEARKRAAANEPDVQRCHYHGCMATAIQRCAGTDLFEKECVTFRCGEHLCPCPDGERSPLTTPASERAAGELVADVDMLASAIRRHSYMTPRALAEALVAAGFGNVAAARREIAEAERRGARALLAAFEALGDEWDGTVFKLPPGYPMNVNEFCRHWFKAPLREVIAAHQIGADS